MAERALQAPASPAELFSACMRLALQGFGGVLPVAQRELVERRRWLSQEQFLALLSMAQVLPGPNIINLVLMLGDRHFGWRGAAAALGGILLAPLALVLMLAALVGQFDDWPAVAGALRGMGVVAAGLVLSTAAKLSRGLGRNPLGAWGCAALALLTTLAVGGLRWPLVWVVLGLGGLGCGLAWRRLAP
jgi:chromate transporter